MERKVAEEFVTELDADGKLGRRNGITIRRGARRQPAVKAAVSRLSRALEKEGVGPRGILFDPPDRGAYRPRFRLGVVLYSASSPGSTP